MYDPLIVDKFLSVYKELAPQDLSQSVPSGVALGAIARVAVPIESPAISSGLDDIAASTEEMLVLYELARGLAGHVQLADAGDVISKHLRRIVPASTCVFYIYEADRDDLFAAHAAGDNASHFVGLRIARGERLTGWVAANRQTILNSDPILDLGEAARVIKPRLRSCLSTPLLNQGQLVGVLSVYSTQLKAFTDDHRRVIEVIGRQISKVVKYAVEAELTQHPRRGDQLTGLPHSQQLEAFVTSELESRAASDYLSIVLLQVHGEHSRESERSLVTPESLAFVVDGVRRALRGADVLSRFGEHELVVLLAQTDNNAAQLVASRMAAALFEDSSLVSRLQPVTTFIAVATAPTDGTSLDMLVQTARGRLRAVKTIHSDSPPSIH